MVVSRGGGFFPVELFPCGGRLTKRVSRGVSQRVCRRQSILERCNETISALNSMSGSVSCVVGGSLVGQKVRDGMFDVHSRNGVGGSCMTPQEALRSLWGSAASVYAASAATARPYKEEVSWPTEGFAAQSLDSLLPAPVR